MTTPRPTPFPCAAALLTALLAFPACRPSRVFVGPVPAEIRSVEGDASLRLTRDGRTARSRFSFVLEPSRRGRVTIEAALGATAAEIVLDGSDGWFVLPSDRVYWKASAEEIADKLLGTPLSLEEMTGLLCGRWEGGGSGRSPEGWALERDAQGRIASGRRGGLDFAVREFFPGGSVPRVLDYRDASGQGRLTVRSLEFNGPGAAGAFDLGFLRAFAPKSWEEIRRMLDHED
jgi:hypothetical protein